MRILARPVVGRRPVDAAASTSRPAAVHRPTFGIVGAAAASVGSCYEDVCGLGGPAPAPFAGGSRQPHHAERGPAPVEAAPEASVKTKKDEWWQRDKDLWIEVHTEEEFRKEISTGTRPVVVDFYATWCHGCEKSYPEICRIIRDPELQKKFKFVKVCVDEMKAVAKAEGINALPRVLVYMPGRGLLTNIDVPFSKLRNFRHNLNVILMNPSMAFTSDPNGFVVPTGPAKPEDAAKKAAEKAKEIEKLNSGNTGLFEHLLRVANVTSSRDGGDKPAAAAAAAAPTAAAGSTNGKPSTSSSAGAAAAFPGLGEKPVTCKPPPGSDPVAYDRARKEFLAVHGAEYGYGGMLDQLYPTEVGCRMAPNEHYMDYTGSSVYCQSQIDAVFAELRQCMFGNPHSANPSSSFTSDRIEEVRDMVLQHFNASPAEYQVVFTRSATGALKMVGETFPWTEGSMFRYLRENHNSVLGVREYALQAGGAFQAVNDSFVERWAVRGDAAGDHIPPNTRFPQPIYSLFAFPAEDNFAGVKYPLSWVEAIQSRSTDQHRWLVMVDAAAYVPTQPLDLSKTPVDFVDMSFYKMFGYPTGVGALIVRTSVVPLLKKVFWGGGTVALAAAEDNFHVLKCKPSDRLEDGTVAFLDIISIKHGLNMMNKLGGIHKVQGHVACLTEWLYTRLSTMRHTNGQPMFAIFGRHHVPNHRQVQGGILNFEVLTPTGEIFSYKTFEKEAAAAGFHVRTGAECNPGACYNYLGVKESEVESLAGKKEGCEDDVEFIKVQRPAAAAATIHSSDLLKSIANSNLSLGHPGEVALKWVDAPLGSVRVSLGWWSTFDDCYALADWVEKTYRDRHC